MILNGDDNWNTSADTVHGSVLMQQFKPEKLDEMMTVLVGARALRTSCTQHTDRDRLCPVYDVKWMDTRRVRPCGLDPSAQCKCMPAAVDTGNVAGFVAREIILTWVPASSGCCFILPL